MFRADLHWYVVSVGQSLVGLTPPAQQIKSDSEQEVVQLSEGLRGLPVTCQAAG